jgi:sigma-B regulation protein RsbU (phosphoserine phosphatase)
VGIAVTLIYERPIRRFIDRCPDGPGPAGELPEELGRRVLNEPIVLVVMDLSIWVFAAFFWSGVLWGLGQPTPVVLHAAGGSLSVGLITCTVAFFVLEHVSQKVWAPFFFPRGGLYQVPGTFRISIRVRLAALLMACNLVPFLTTLTLYWRIRAAGLDAAEALARMGTALTVNSLLFIVVGSWLLFIVGRNLATPFRAIIRTLREVSAGRFDRRVAVTTNDEIGYTGDVINAMTEGLRERERLRLSLLLAQEVQQRLLPAAAPAFTGLDVAGASRYCDETGGDYFDYLTMPSEAGERLGVVVGDVAGHGLSAALLMVSARGFFRQRAALGGAPESVLSDVNAQLCRDVGDSGQFMTAFLLLANGETGDIAWVRAGHDPALLYDPEADRFTPLEGPGIPLGVEPGAAFEVRERRGLIEGSIILLGTDGIWETADPDGAMFGKERLLPLVRTGRGESAQALRDRILGALETFRGPAAAADDVTLVVVKFDRSPVA